MIIKQTRDENKESQASRHCLDVLFHFFIGFVLKRNQIMCSVQFRFLCGKLNLVKFACSKDVCLCDIVD